MVHLATFLACLLVFISRSRSTVFVEEDGEVALESVIHFHGGPSSIPMKNLSEVLLLISRETAGAEESLLADPEVRLLYTLGILIRTAINYFEHSITLFFFF